MKAIDKVGGERRRLLWKGGGGGEKKQKLEVAEVRWFSNGQTGCSSGRMRASFIAGLMN